MRGIHWKCFSIDDQWPNEMQCSTSVELPLGRCNPIATAALPRRKSEAVVGQEGTEEQVRFASEWRCEMQQAVGLKLVLTFLFPSMST